MPINADILNNLDPSRVDEVADLMVATFRDISPEVDVSRGSALYNLVIRPQALLHVLNESKIDETRRSSSLLEISKDPELANDAIVDATLSNYKIVRQEGTPASGQVVLTFNRLSPGTITPSVIFTGNGVQFNPTRTFNLVTSTDDVVTSADRVLRQTGENHYSATIDVIALSEGTSGNLPAATTFTSSINLPGVISIYALSDFSGGRDTESNEDLLDRALDGMSTPNLGSRITTRATIGAAFPGIKDVSTVGAGDPEMVRDRLNPMGISTGGKADIYVRVGDAPRLETITKEATVDQVTALGSFWRVVFTRDEFPGLYEVTKVQLPTGTKCEIKEQSPGVDLSSVPGVDIVPHLDSFTGRFSRYQTLSVTFYVEGDISREVGDTDEFDVTLLYMPGISEISDYVLSRDIRHPSGDYLVKAAVPCAVTADVVIKRAPGAVTVDTDQVKTVVVDVINSRKFTDGSIPSSLIAAEIYKVLPAKATVMTPITMSGRILSPRGETLWSWTGPGNSYELSVPSRSDLGVTPNTTFFYTNVNLVTVDVRHQV